MLLARPHATDANEPNPRTETLPQLVDIRERWLLVARCRQPPFGEISADSVSVSTTRQLPMVFMVTTYAAALVLVDDCGGRVGPSK